MKKKIRLTESELIRVIKEIRDNIALRRRFKEGLDELEVRKVISVVMNDLYLEDYSNARSYFEKCLNEDEEDYSALYNIIYCNISISANPVPIPFFILVG